MKKVIISLALILSLCLDFQTVSAAVDIENVRAIFLDSKTVTFVWETGVPEKSDLFLGISEEFVNDGSVAGIAFPGTSEETRHHANWQNGDNIPSGHVLYYQIKTISDSNYSQVYEAQMPTAQELSSKSVVIKNARITNLTSSSATISWETDVPTIGYLKVESNAREVVKDMEIYQESTQHSINVGSLVPSRVYFVKIESYQNSGDLGDIATLEFEAAEAASNDTNTGTLPSASLTPASVIKVYPYTSTITTNSIIFNAGSSLLQSQDYVNILNNLGVIYAETEACLLSQSCRQSARAHVEGVVYYKIAINNLKPGTKYYYKTFSSGVESDEVMNFTTQSESSNQDPIVTPSANQNDVTTSAPTQDNISANLNLNSPSVSDSPVMSVNNVNMYNNLKGKILLLVESLGEAYYVHPLTRSMFYLGRPNDAFRIMREQGIGITNVNLEKIPVGLSNLTGTDSDGDGLPDLFEDAIGTLRHNADTDSDGFGDKSELAGGYDPKKGNGTKIINDLAFANLHKGKIFLQVESVGEAWYVNPADGKRYFLGRPGDAFNIMRNLGLGISNENFDILK